MYIMMMQNKSEDKERSSWSGYNYFPKVINNVTINHYYLRFLYDILGTNLQRLGCQ